MKVGKMDPEIPAERARADLFVGLMSGTSMDGIDAVLVEFDASSAKLVATHYLPYPRCITERLLALQRGEENELHVAARLGIEITHLYAQAVVSLLDAADIGACAVRAIGCHGQTVRHNPVAGYSLQLSNPSLLAELSGISVVSDFRSRDIAAGGQGAPLVPAFHEAMFRSASVHRVVLNIGGIANLTNLDPAAATTGFDTGPGNVLLDAWAHRHIGTFYDKDGAWAAQGRVNTRLLDTLLEHPYFCTPPPKSCGREQFNLDWVEPYLTSAMKPADVQATLLELTLRSIVTAIERWLDIPDELIVCGGGAHNKRLIEGLAAHLPRTKVLTSDNLGIGADWVEAMAFAWLARRTLLGLPGNLATVTGAKGARILGAIYPK
jgi:anhydro-N-acetylmuramic acid kinase